ncbi:MAG: hypothetical protein E7397_04595 [Ruminococcaceae bacterium]|nr:hypothetical protein [Oscillospiraceae bacterium]
MIVKTFNPVTLEEKETIPEIISIVYNKRFYRVGSFEIKTTSNKFSENDIIAFFYNGMIHSGIVLKIIEQTDSISILGNDLKGIYGFRYVTNPKEQKGTPDAIIKSFVTEFLLTGDRKIAGLTISADTIDGNATSFTPEAKMLDEILEELCLANEIGTAVEFDLRGLQFRTLKGADLSENIKFGKRYRNLEDYTYTRDIFQTYNVGYSVDDEGTEIVTGTAAGILRRECFKEKNIDEYLAEHGAMETIVAEASDRYIYGKDYNLGDYVTVETERVQTVMQITEIKEIFERRGNVIIPVFGVEKQNPIKKLLRKE